MSTGAVISGEEPTATARTMAGKSSDIEKQGLNPAANECTKQSLPDSSNSTASCEDLVHGKRSCESAWRKTSGTSHLLHSLLSGVGLDDYAVGSRKSKVVAEEAHDEDTDTKQWSNSCLSSLMCLQSAEKFTASKGVENIPEREFLNRDTNVCPAAESESTKDPKFQQAVGSDNLRRVEDRQSNDIAAEETCSFSAPAGNRGRLLGIDEQFQSVPDATLLETLELQTVLEVGENACKGTAAGTTEERNDDAASHFSAKLSEFQAVEMEVADGSTAPAGVQSAEVAEDAVSQGSSAGGKQPPGEHSRERQQSSRPEGTQKDLKATHKKTSRKSRRSIGDPDKAEGEDTRRVLCSS